MGAGNDAATWTIGWKNRDMRSESPIANPAGTVQRVPMMEEASTRAMVTPPALPSSNQVPRLIPVRNLTRATEPQTTRAISTTRARLASQREPFCAAWTAAGVRRHGRARGVARASLRWVHLYHEADQPGTAQRS